MKYEYKFKEIEGFENGLVIELPKHIEAVAGFLTEINDEEKAAHYIQIIDDVISEKTNVKEIYANISGLKIEKNFTYVFEHLADDGVGINCYIETEELKNLILVWMDELNKYQQKKEKEYQEKLNEFIRKTIEPDQTFRNDLLKIIEKKLILQDNKEETIQKGNYEIDVYSYTVHAERKDDTSKNINIRPEDLKETILKINEQKERENGIMF